MPHKSGAVGPSAANPASHCCVCSQVLPLVGSKILTGLHMRLVFSVARCLGLIMWNKWWANVWSQTVEPLQDRSKEITSLMYYSMETVNAGKGPHCLCSLATKLCCSPLFYRKTRAPPGGCSNRLHVKYFRQWFKKTKNKGNISFANIMFCAISTSLWSSRLISISCGLQLISSSSSSSSSHIMTHLLLHTLKNTWSALYNRFGKVWQWFLIIIRIY